MLVSFDRLPVMVEHCGSGSCGSVVVVVAAALGVEIGGLWLAVVLLPCVELVRA